MTCTSHAADQAATTDLSTETLPEFLARGGQEQVYDVVIVGSGYGGSVAAYALAAAAAAKDQKDKPRVLVLERGREFKPGSFSGGLGDGGRQVKPGSFPAGLGDLPREMRIAHQETGEVSGHEGLFDIRLGPDVVAMVANGVGGGSLINAGVMLEPEPDDIANTPDTAPHCATLLKHLRMLKAGQAFTRAARLLGGQVKRDGLWVHNDVTRLPTAKEKTYALPKAQALHDLVAEAAKRDKPAAGQPASKTPTGSTPVQVTVAWDTQPNIAKVSLEACNQCGDCMTGCNVGAKNSLDRSLLLRAKQLLADRLVIVTGATVGSLAQASSRRMGAPDGNGKGTSARGWRLRLFHTDARLQAREIGQLKRRTASGARLMPTATGTLYLHARRVVLAAGTLGSPEILMRSRTDKLQFSSRLGESFSGNGDDIAALHRLPNDVHGSADERVERDQRGVGPTVTARVTLQGKYRPFQVEEFAVPAAVKRLFDELVTTGWAIAQLPKGDCQTHSMKDADPMAVDPAAMQETLLVGVVGHDSADGSLRLAQPLRPRDAAPQLGALRIHWPQARHGAEFEDAHATLRQFVEGSNPPKSGQQPVLVANPMWRLLPNGLEDLVSQPRGPVLTVHPLGGCRIGNDAEEGVVDTVGRVFNTRSGSKDDTFDSLVVLDGSIIGSSLGVNPALTISALALHAMDEHVKAWGIGPATGDPETEPGTAAESGEKRPAPSSPCTRPPDDAPPLPSATEVSITERLWGRVALNDDQGQVQQQVMELTLAFEAQPVSTLIGRERKPMQVLPQASRLRLYAAKKWDELALQAASDDERAPFVDFEASLHGDLRFLHRQPSGPIWRTLRGLWAYFCNRGTRDALQRFREPLRHDEKRKGLGLAGIADFGRLASRNGQRRLFDYTLYIVDPWSKAGSSHGRLGADKEIKGSKVLGYARRTSPWTQLTEMQLLQMPGLVGQPTLKLDARYLAQQGKPLLHIEHQRNHAEALAELLSFGLYLLRVLLDTHLWSFRRPDRHEPREPYRLPAGIVGVPEPEITTLVVDRWQSEKGAIDEPVSIRLTRYKPKPKPKPKPPAVVAAKDGSAPKPPELPEPPPKPLVMVHGYSASGTTFTHPSLGLDAAAAFFCKAGRDVWVVDLRTSCGLPSALRPWAMEQPALVDIPAALLHIRNATGQKVDVLAHCIGGVMLGMALLSDAAWVRSGKLELGADAWLTNEHFGTLSAFNGSGPISNGHPTVDRVVLSQKGPVLRYTDANVLRAYVLQFARRWLLPATFNFQSSRDPAVAEQLLDRFLSSLPYPRADFDVENPMWPCARTEWVASRHRLDALFGRVFNAANLRPDTLKAIDELFGPINLDTVAQTIHFARLDTITNQRGRGEFVTLRRLRERWGGIPTMVLHGQDNGMVDPYTHRLLSEQLQAAGVPVHAPRPIEGTGHQDCLIGVGAREAVLKPIEDFLKGPIPARKPSAQQLAACVCAEPWIGPRLKPQAGGGLEVAAMSRPDQGVCTLWLVPVLHDSTPGAALPYRPLQGAGYPWLGAGQPQASGQWHRATPVLTMAPAPAGGELGWLVLHIYATEETNARPARVDPAASGASAPPRHSAGPVSAKVGQSSVPGLPTVRAVMPRPGFPLSHRTKLQWHGLRAALDLNMAQTAGTGDGPSADIWDAVREWLHDEGPAVHAQCFISLEAARQAAQLHAVRKSPQPEFRFALASCQYPHGLFDTVPAAASLQALAKEPVQMALMVGDQIYADATAGLVDPSRRDELYDQPHERALRQAGMRAVLRQMPVTMLLDDHELFDNWQPLPDALPRYARRVRKQRERIDDARRHGVAAYMKYQRMAAASAVSPAHIDDSFTAGGYPFYLLDTRTGRERGAPSQGAANGLIVSPARLAALKNWLTLHADRVKFVVTPSMLLPRQVEVVGRPGNACRADAWDGFPASLANLLRHIGNPDQPIRKTVFLSGDVHHSLYTEAYLGEGAQRVKLVSVHSSALYAPYPFANGRLLDLCATENGNDLGIALDSNTVPAREGDGYAVLHVSGEPMNPVLHIEFSARDGQAAISHSVSL